MTMGAKCTLEQHAGEVLNHLMSTLDFEHMTKISFKHIANLVDLRSSDVRNAIVYLTTLGLTNVTTDGRGSVAARLVRTTEKLSVVERMEAAARISAPNRYKT
jgi:predicted transcriptional regulator